MATFWQIWLKVSPLSLSLSVLSLSISFSLDFFLFSPSPFFSCLTISHLPLPLPHPAFSSPPPPPLSLSLSLSLFSLCQYLFLLISFFSPHPNFCPVSQSPIFLPPSSPPPPPPPLSLSLSLSLFVKQGKSTTSLNNDNMFHCGHMQTAKPPIQQLDCGLFRKTLPVPASGNVVDTFVSRSQWSGHGGLRDRTPFVLAATQLLFLLNLNWQTLNSGRPFWGYIVWQKEKGKKESRSTW